MAEQGGQAQPAAQQGWMPTLLKWAMMYFAINMFMSKWRGNPPPTVPTDNEGNPIPIPIGQQPHSPLWKPNVHYNIRIYLSEQPDLDSVISGPDATDSLIYSKAHLPFSCDSEAFTQKAIDFPVPPSLQNNGSYYAHIVLTQFGYPYEETDPDYDHTRVVLRSHPLITYMAVGGEPVLAFWKPQLTLSPLCDWSTYNYGDIPAELVEHVTIDSISNKYFPVLYMDDFLLFGDGLIALNSSVATVPLLISVSPISNWKFKFQTYTQQQYEQQTKWAIVVKWIMNRFMNVKQMVM